MKIRGSRRIVKRLGLALAIAAFIAPSAQAAVLVENDGPLASSQTRLYADDLHGSTPVSPAPIQSRLYADDRHEAVLSSPVADAPRGYAPINTQVRLPAVTSEAASDSSRFNWGDAGIGAGIMFALVGFGAAILAGRQTRRSRLSAA